MIFYFQAPEDWFPTWFPICGTSAPGQSGSPINRKSILTTQVQRPPSCCDTPKFYIGHWTYTAKNEITGQTATVTRQCRSSISEAHAQVLARQAAIREAQAEVR